MDQKGARATTDKSDIFLVSVVAKRQPCWAAFSTSVDRFLKESRAFRGLATS